MCDVPMTSLTAVTTLQQVLAQLLCNLVSPSEEAAEGMADTILALYLSGDRDADVIMYVAVRFDLTSAACSTRGIRGRM